MTSNGYDGAPVVPSANPVVSHLPSYVPLLFANIPEPALTSNSYVKTGATPAVV